jgi:hypothetical protein
MSEASDCAENQATDFAQRLEDMLTEVLGPTTNQYTADPQGMRRRNSISYLIKTKDSEGIPLMVGGDIVLRLSYRYQCSCHDQNSYLQVDDSSITLRAESDSAPIVHYDYVRDPHGTIPAAHINIHASNDSATKAMLACGSKSQGKSRRKAFLDKGAFPTFSSLHFPVGGDRFRPGLEDVLQMAIYEFGIDAQPRWRGIIEQSRAEYRVRQLEALVCEFPDIAYNALERNGYLDNKQMPQRPVRKDIQSRLTKY